MLINDMTKAIRTGKTSYDVVESVIENIKKESNVNLPIGSEYAMSSGALAVLLSTALDKIILLENQAKS